MLFLSAPAAVFLAVAVSAQPPAASSLVQVAIVRQASAATLATAGAVEIVEPGGRRRTLGWKGPIPLKPREGGLTLADMKVPSETRLVPAAGVSVRVGGDPHAGTLILRLDPGQTITIVEEIPLEDYLLGVLPHEMDPDWPLEALKAQAVVARSFAYANLGRFKSEGFDLTADTRTQVYRGLTDVNENVRAAVRQTRGEVLGWNGQLLRTYFHACCGGHTENSAEVWGGDPKKTPKPLRGVADKWCRTAPPMHWTAYFAWQDLLEAFAEKANLPGPVKSLRLGRRDPAGYVRDFVARAGRADVHLKASDVRLILGAGELKSTRILHITAKKKGVEFVGSGSGHGVGLCQWGARRQAEAGRGYEKILRFYFPGATLSVVDQ
jgi:stage II sporulation protein D